jgi:hypothetical protein
MRLAFTSVAALAVIFLPWGGPTERASRGGERALVGDVPSGGDGPVKAAGPEALERGGAGASRVEREAKPPQLQVMLWFLKAEKGKGAADKEATEVVTRFLIKLKGEDYKGAAELTGLPWLGEGGRALEREDEVRKSVPKARARLAVTRSEWKAGGSVSSSEARGLVAPGGGRKLLEQVLGKEGRVVFVASRDPDEMPRGMYLLVAKRGAGLKVVGGPYRLTYLLVDNGLPGPVRVALEKAERFELLSLDPADRKVKPKEGYHGWRVLGTTAVKGEEARKRARAGLDRALEFTGVVPASCFQPRHGIRVTYKKDTFDLVICFECARLSVLRGDEELIELLVNPSAQAPFDRALRDAGTPLAKKAGAK